MKKRILVDLKPALDGYAGIPQESRLLFLDLLKASDSFETHGLLQHGGDWLKASTTSAADDKGLIAKNSETVISFYGRRGKHPLRKAYFAVRRYAKLTILRIQTIVGHVQSLGHFDGTHFQDFVWNRFFSKTLTPESQKHIAQARYRVLLPSRKAMHQMGLTAHRLNLRAPYPKIDTSDYDYFIAQTPFPGRVSENTQLIVRYHDAVPVLMPHTIGDKKFHQASHYWALRQNVEDGAWFACISEATRQDLITLFPQADAKSFVIHNFVSDSYTTEKSEKRLILTTILDRAYRANGFSPNLEDIGRRISEQDTKHFDYLLMVSTLEPRKNHLQLLAAWEELKESAHPLLKLILVGNPGWDYTSILDAIRPWAERGDLLYLHNVPQRELNRLYQHASATVCPSLAEGFDYTGVEAMKSGSPLAASDIPVHREIYGESAAYFNPYDTRDMAENIGRLLRMDGEETKANMQTGIKTSQKYDIEALLPQWRELLLNASPNTNAMPKTVASTGENK